MRSTNRIAEATESFVRVIQALNTHPTLSNDPVMLTAVHTNLGEIYYELKQYGEAANAFEKALLHLSDDSEDRCFALLWLGQCYRGKGEYGRARDCYEEVLALASASDENREAARKSLAALPPLPERRIH
jgi:tetratricopeptide (TPR) repeat protein